LTFAAPELAKAVELDSEAGAFFAVGPKRALKAIQKVIEELAASPYMVEDLISRADAAGFTFDD
jgi:hypothetical protein